LIGQKAYRINHLSIPNYLSLSPSTSLISNNRMPDCLSIKYSQWYVACRLISYIFLLWLGLWY
jgi:hypothetical protein